MKSTLSNVLIFAAGAAIGSLVTWYFTKTKYEQIMREEEEATRAYYEGRYPAQGDGDTESEQDYHGPIPEDVDSLIDILNNNGYATCDDTERDTVKTGVEKRMLVDPPYTITPDEYGEIDGYEMISLIFFSDGVLTDDDYELVDDVDGTVGRENLTTFGEYQDDCVFVRNDRLKCDYEICFDQRTYWDEETIVAGEENLGEDDEVFEDDDDDYETDPQDAEEE